MVERRRIRRLLAPVALIVIGVWLLAGCVYIPTFSTTTSGKSVGGSVGAADSRRPLRVSRSTLDDVLRVLGKPPHATSDGRVLAYPWSVRHGIVVWPLCFAGYSVNGQRTLVLRLDERHVLRSFEILRQDDNILDLYGGARGAKMLPPEIWGDRAEAMREKLGRWQPSTRTSTAPATRPR